MEWTTERRYRRYEDWSNDEIKQIKEKMAQSPWHTHYHVEPWCSTWVDVLGAA